MIGPSPIYLEHSALPDKSTSLDCSVQNRNKHAHYGPPFQFIHMRVELWANHYGIKVRCYWEPFGNLMGTHMFRDSPKYKFLLDNGVPPPWPTNIGENGENLGRA